MPTITLKAATKHYGDPYKPAIKALDLRIEDGEFMCLLGPSGCGKTTTLRLIAGLENLSDGSIHLDETPVDHPDQGQFVSPDKRKLGLVFQSYALWPHMSVRRNIEFGFHLQKKSKIETRQASENVMQALGILDYGDRYPSQLSGGQQQRVALARMLVVNPQILLLDEPLSNLDARLRLQMRTELQRIHSHYQSTLVFVTHDQWEAMALATRIAVMNEGIIQQVGTPTDIYERPANRFVAEFIGSPPINMINMDDAGSVIKKIITSLLGEFAMQQIRTIGIRPEHIQLTNSQEANTLNATVVSEIPTGGQSICELALDQHTLLMTTLHASGLPPGSQVRIAIPVAALNCFDQQGLRIPSAAKPADTGTPTTSNNAIEQTSPLTTDHSNDPPTRNNLLETHQETLR